jgi:hypothetical protein
MRRKSNSFLDLGRAHRGRIINQLKLDIPR